MEKAGLEDGGEGGKNPKELTEQEFAGLVGKRVDLPADAYRKVRYGHSGNL